MVSGRLQGAWSGSEHWVWGVERESSVLLCIFISLEPGTHLAYRCWEYMSEGLKKRNVITRKKTAGENLMAL